jgi:hypothetical protein
LEFAQHLDLYLAPASASIIPNLSVRLRVVALAVISSGSKSIKHSWLWSQSEKQTDQSAKGLVGKFVKDAKKVDKNMAKKSA